MSLRDIKKAHPNLLWDGVRKTSDADTSYNCIAHAAGDMQSRRWPDLEGQYTWPEGVPREATAEALVAAFATLGYAVCAGEEWEPPHE